MLIYQDEYVQVHHGDCAEITPTLGRFDLLLTDPPYGIGEDGKSNHSRAAASGLNGKRGPLIQSTKFKAGEWDKSTPAPELLSMLIGQAKHQIIWGGNYFGLPAARGWLVWDKDNSGDFADCELAYTNLDMAVRKLTWRWNGMLQQDMKNKEKRLHPTQKPTPVMEWCLSFVPDAQTVFDPFAGSGTTGVACKRHRRKCVLIERDFDYCQIIIKRLKETEPMMECVIQSASPLAQLSFA